MFRGTWGEKNDGEIQMWERRKREQVMDGRRERRCRIMLRGERDDRTHVEWMW
jgi:hypothetical protein